MLDSNAAEIALTGNRELQRRLPLFNACCALGIVASLFAIVLRRPEVIALAAPFLVAVASAIALWRPVEGTVRFTLSEPRVVEGEEVDIIVELASTTGMATVEIEISPTERLAAGGTLRAVTSLRPNSTRTLRFSVTATDWGIATVERVTLRVSDRFSMFGGETQINPGTAVRIGLPEDRVRSSLEAERFRRIVGSHLSNDRGQGMEIADIRPFQPGDSTRHINWRISNRRREPWVTLRHPDRSTTVLVIVDAHDGGSEEQLSTQRRSVAAAMALTRGHLAMHDRVGLLVVGHTLRWLPPKLGRNQLFSIRDELVAIGNAPAASRRMYRPPAVSTISNNTIVVAVSPLRDPLMVALVGEIRSRGNPVSVLVPELEVAPARRMLITTRTDEHARRFARVEQKIGVQSLRERGVAIVPWGEDEPVVTVIAAAQRLRQSMARGRSW